MTRQRLSRAFSGLLERFGRSSTVESPETPQEGSPGVSEEPWHTGVTLTYSEPGPVQVAEECRTCCALTFDLAGHHNWHFANDQAIWHGDRG